MSETSIILDELRERVRRFVEMATRIGVQPEELAEEALERFPPPANDTRGGDLLAERVASLAHSTRMSPRVVTAAVMLPPGRAKAFEAVEAASAFRKRLERKYGEFPSSLSLIREDRDR